MIKRLTAPFLLAMATLGLAVASTPDGDQVFVRSFGSLSYAGEEVKGNLTNNLLLNPSFDGVPPTSWKTYSRLGSDIPVSHVARGNYVEITTSTGGNQVHENAYSWYQQITLENALTEYRNFYVAVRIKSTLTKGYVEYDGGPGLVPAVYDGAGRYIGGYDSARIGHDTGGAWEWLSEKHTLPPGSKIIDVNCQVKNALGTFLFDDASFYLGEVVQVPSTTPLDQNLLRNPTPTEGLYYPDFWWTYQGSRDDYRIGGADWMWDNRQALEITNLNILNQGAAWVQTLEPLTLGTTRTCHISARVKANLIDVAAGGGVRIGVEAYSAGAWSSQSFYSPLMTALGDTGWTHVTVTATLTPTINELRFVLRFGYAVGRAWVSNMSVILT